MGSTPALIKKRDGRIVPFNKNNISGAILKAAKSTGEFSANIALSLTEIVIDVAERQFAGEAPTVEEIQDIVEDVLLKSPYKKTAKSYIIYREQHARLREIASGFNARLVEQYLQKTDWQVNENSNMSYSLQGLNNYISTEISKTYWLNEIYPQKIREAHAGGDFHIHDLGLLSVYCVGWDLYDLLVNGFRGVPGKIESKPAKHFRTALGQITNFFYTLQGEAAGAQAFANFDTLLAPFIYYDRLNYLEVKQALQEFLFNVNVPTRVGFQTPFTNVTFDLEVPSYYAGQGVVIGGVQQEKTYGEFSEEINIFNKAFLEVMAEGDAKGRVFTFPIPTYNITKDFNWDNPYLEKLWEVTAKYGLPYFANFVNSDMQPEDARSMCCRLRIDNRKLEKRGGGLFGSAPLTGSVGVVTINMPRIGIIAKNEDEFFERLSALMETAGDSLEIKRKTLEQFTENGLYPYTKHYLRNIKARFNEYWKNHFSTIGIVGMNEACLNFLGKDIRSDEGRNFALKVTDFMRDKLFEFQEKTGNNYNLEATPAEGTSYRLALKDKGRFPKASFANMEGVAKGLPPFYTNSTFLPVDYSDDLFEILDLQDDFQAKYTGGTVLHLFAGERIKDTAALVELIKTISGRYRLPYFSFTPTFSICPVCGYLDGEQSACKHCGSECEVYSRVVGYLRPVSQWNEGKQEEFKLRKTILPI
jgi:ribonucleoside-triphosphate reductase